MYQIDTLCTLNLYNDIGQLYQIKLEKFQSKKMIVSRVYNYYLQEGLSKKATKAFLKKKM